ncbi:MAG TPA: hypothetical protein VH475_23065 [Tepidisphaeraceae bacterium]|jgi:hypothetical protein
MKTLMPALAALAAVLLSTTLASALTEELHSPRILFGKTFDPNKAAAITAVIQDRQFHFIDGQISYWEPDWATTLVYDGDTRSLNNFLGALAAVPKLRVNVLVSKDLASRTHGAHATGAWWLEYRHTAPDTVTVRVNLAAKGIDPDQLRLQPAPAKAPDAAKSIDN